MKSRERLLRALRGEPVDHTPWSPFLAYYWESLPQSVREQGQFEYMKAMGADPLLRGFHTLSRIEYKNCEITERKAGRESYTTYTTPVGSLTEKRVYSPDGDTTFLVGHAVSDEEDFKVLQYIHEHMEVTPDAARFEQDLKTCGDDALLLPVIGVHLKTAFQSLIERWVGTENLAYALCDFPEVVEECLAVMQERDAETVRDAVNTAADGFIFWEDSSTTNISPAYFKKYTMPQVNQWGEAIHRSGKLLVHHACGHIKDLVPIMATTEIDAIESITPPPTGNIELRDAAELLPEHIALIGGLEPVRLLKRSTEEVCDDARALLRDLKGHRFVLANSDSCPPGVEYEKFTAVAALVKE